MPTEPKSNTEPGLGRSVLLPGCMGCSLGCLGTLALCAGAAALGFAILPFNTALFAGLAGGLLILITALVARIKGRRRPWRLFAAELTAVVLLLMAFFLWDTPRHAFRCVMGDRIPGSVRILRAEFFEHPMDPVAWVHFEASPSDLSALLRGAELEPDPDAKPDQPALNVQPGWWRPANLDPAPTLFTRKWEGSPVGVWVSARTNEGYGYHISH
jgi:hypothetical protein